MKEQRPLPLQKARGMRDWLPENWRLLRFLEQEAMQVAQRYGYQEISTPFIEPLSLFQRAVGEATEVVSKEMFHLVPGGDATAPPLVLRPEATASCVRAGIEASKFRHQTQRWSYFGPMFRRERPQMGRYRQFYQWGCEWFGSNALQAEVELILTGQALIKRLGLEPYVRLEIHTLGLRSEREAYLTALKTFLVQHLPKVDCELSHRIQVNPLRVLDSKSPDIQAILEKAPRLIDFLGQSSRDRFEACCAGLKLHQCQYSIAHRLVRGLDYYQGLVFEWVTEALGAQSAIGGGGRYDGLVSALGGPETSSLGFAFGMDRVMLLGQKLGIWNPPQPLRLLVCVEASRSGAQAQRDAQCLLWAEWLRSHHPEVNFLTLPGVSMETQYKRAVGEGVLWALQLPEAAPPAVDQAWRLKHLELRWSQVCHRNNWLELLRDKESSHERKRIKT